MFPGSVATGSPIKFFLEPTAETLNYLKAQGYADFAMTGLSGGGWTTMLYSAIDPTIRQSFPVGRCLCTFVPGTLAPVMPSRSCLSSTGSPATWIST